MIAEERVAQAAASLRARGVAGPFDAAFVLGTGFGRLFPDLEDRLELPYGEIPHFPSPGVSGHAGTLIAGTAENRRVLILAGRSHYYETGDPAAMRVPVGVVAQLGAPPLVLTNAAGSLREELPPGRYVLVTDHINYSGLNPLIGEPGEARFVPMAGAYDEELRHRCRRAAAAAGVALGEGVYMWFSGPSFETAAEVRMARTLGADLVGMSTVPEVILARYHGLRVAALSLVTNYGSGMTVETHGHEGTKAAAAAAGSDLRRLLLAFLAAGADAPPARSLGT